MTLEGIYKATNPAVSGDITFHTGLKKGDIPGYIITPGSPERTEKIARNWENVKQVAHYRQYKTLTGTYKGLHLGTTSSGVGAASAEICITELRKAGMHTCIRVGTTGSIDPNYDIGDLIIPLACIRKDGTSVCYIEPEFPSFADTRVVLALVEACERLGFRYGVCLEYSPGSFYVGQGRRLYDDERGFWPSWADRIIPDLQALRVSNIEMDTAGHFVVAYLNGVRMGAILVVVANRLKNTCGYNGGEERACLAASEAMKILAEWDEKM